VLEKQKWSQTAREFTEIQGWGKPPWKNKWHTIWSIKFCLKLQNIYFPILTFWRGSYISATCDLYSDQAEKTYQHRTYNELRYKCLLVTVITQRIAAHLWHRLMDGLRSFQTKGLHFFYLQHRLVVSKLFSSFLYLYLLHNFFWFLSISSVCDAVRITRYSIFHMVLT